jgi:hypothetical protein
MWRSAEEIGAASECMNRKRLEKTGFDGITARWWLLEVGELKVRAQSRVSLVRAGWIIA